MKQHNANPVNYDIHGILTVESDGSWRCRSLSRSAHRQVSELRISRSSSGVSMTRLDHRQHGR